MGNGDPKTDKKPSGDEHFKIDTDTLQNDPKDPVKGVRNLFLESILG